MNRKEELLILLNSAILGSSAENYNLHVNYLKDSGVQGLITVKDSDVIAETHGTNIKAILAMS